MGLAEREATLGGNHLWCFSRLGPERGGAQARGKPLVVQRWSGYTVRFPSFERRLDTPYAAVHSDRVAEYVTRVFAEHSRSRLWLGRRAEQVLARRVVLDGGEVLNARVVIDARGPDGRRLAARAVVSAARPAACRWLGALSGLDGPKREPTAALGRSVDPGGLYDAAQIDRLKTLKDLTDYGHSIGEVARLSLEELKRLLSASLELSQSK